MKAPTKIERWDCTQRELVEFVLWREGSILSPVDIRVLVHRDFYILLDGRNVTGLLIALGDKAVRVAPGLYCHGDHRAKLAPNAGVAEKIKYKGVERSSLSKKGLIESILKRRPVVRSTLEIQAILDEEFAVSMPKWNICSLLCDLIKRKKVTRVGRGVYYHQDHCRNLNFGEVSP